MYQRLFIADRIFFACRLNVTWHKKSHDCESLLHRRSIPSERFRLKRGSLREMEETFMKINHPLLQISDSFNEEFNGNKRDPACGSGELNRCKGFYSLAAHKVYVHHSIAVNDVD